jgi:hypothetical protein
MKSRNVATAGTQTLMTQLPRRVAAFEGRQVVHGLQKQGKCFFSPDTGV